MYAQVSALARFLLRLASRLAAGFFWLLRYLFGRLAWAPPPWALAAVRGGAGAWAWGRANPRRAGAGCAAVVLIAAASWWGWHWYTHRPQPHRVEYRVDGPAPTDYEAEQLRYEPLRLHFAESVAPLKAVDQAVAAGVRLSPAHPGRWRWRGDRVLEFQPGEDWPVDGAFRVELDEDGLLAAGVLLADYAPEFRSAPFWARVAETQLYQDPLDSRLKKLVASLRFSHPVAEEAVRERVAVELGQGLKYRDEAVQALELSFDKRRLNAFVHSAPLAVPLESTQVTVKLAEGLKAERGGNALEKPLSASATVPGRYRLEFQDLGMQYANNERGEPEQLLMFGSSFGLADEALKGKVKAWLLPAEHPDGRSWWSESDVSEARLAAAGPLALAQVPGAESVNSSHGFRFKAPVGRYVYARIERGVEAVGGYLSKHPVDALFQIADYPKALKLLSDGALLSLKGEHKLAFMAQGLKGVHIEIARLLPNQLHHLVDQNQGSFARPSVYAHEFDRLVERMSYTREFPGADPAKPVYDHVDLGEYLNAGGGRRGVFVLRLTPYDPAEPKRRYGDGEYESGDEPTDRRFVLVTDLGLIAKRSLDGGQDVFVQSLGQGVPVAGAKVEILGRNGLPVQEGTTDADGRISFPKLGELNREKTPLMLVASQGEDLSFLPLGRYDHRLDLSRFDVGGLSNASAASQLLAYGFSDRGLYRPGETAHLGFILRTADWRGQLEGLPLEIQISDPRGATVLERRLRLSASGLESVDFASAESAPAGQYQASVYLVKENRREALLGGVGFTVRDFEPDRMKVSASLSAAPVAGWLKPEQVAARVQARHLFGAPASERRVSGELTLSPAFPAFAAYPDYRFHAGEVMKEAQREKLAETKTDAQGEASLNLGLERFAKSTYRAHVLARVFEAEGGRNVAAEAAVLVSSAPFLVGVKTPDSLSYVSKGAVRKTHWLALDPSLKPVAADKLTLIRYEYRYLSVLVKQANGTYKFESRRKELTRESQAYALPAGGAELALATAEPGEFALVLSDAEGAELNRVAYTVAGDANLSRSLERNAELKLSLDKASYAPGERIAISLRAPYTGAGLITIERDKVYAQQWFKAETTSSVQHITVPAELEGNAYVNVQFLRDPASPEVYMSPLSYGVAPFAVALDARKHTLSVDAPSRLLPGEELAMKLSAGAPVRAVLFAVDEGILQVARYRTPDPLSHFFQKRALEVDTHQILDLLLPEFSRLMGAAPGGDAEGALGRHLNPFKKKRQPPVAYWSGLVDLPAEGREFRWRVPEGFNGRLRILAVAVSPDRIGVFEGGVEVKGPLVLTPNVPAMVAPGDELLVSVGVFNNGEQAVETRLSLKTGPGLKLLSEAATTLKLEPLREAVAEFRLKAGETLGSAELAFEARAGDKRVRLTEAVSVRPATPYLVALRMGRFDAAEHTLKQSRVLHPEFAKVELGLDHSPTVWAKGLADYLSDYSYSCTEQLVSKAMPALIWAEPEALAAGRVPGMDSALAVLMSRQNAEGGFGLWAGNPLVQSAVSVHAVDFLLEAKERGVAVPGELLARSRGFLERLAGSPAEGLPELRARARAAYLLARSGTVVTGPLAAIREQLDAHHAPQWRRDLTAAYLAAAYRLLKQDRLARELDGGVPWRSLDDKDSRWDLYYDGLVHDAELLTLRVRHAPDGVTEVPGELLDRLGQRLSRGEYHSLSAALLLRGLDTYGGKAAKAGGKLAARARLAREQALDLAVAGRPPRAAVPFGTEAIALSKSGDTPGFYVLTEAGFDQGVPAAELKQGLELIREFTDLAGKPIKTVALGEEFLVRLRLRALDRDSVSQVAVVDLLPGGVEPVFNAPAEHVPPRSDEGECRDCEGEAESVSSAWVPPLGERTQSDWAPEFADVREDRIVLYGTATRDVRTYVYRLRAINAGRYTAPPPYAEGMYEPTLQGRGLSARFDIVKP